MNLILIFVLPKWTDLVVIYEKTWYHGINCIYSYYFPFRTQTTVLLTSLTIYLQANKDTKNLTRLSQSWATWQINFTIITI